MSTFFLSILRGQSVKRVHQVTKVPLVWLACLDSEVPLVILVQKVEEAILDYQAQKAPRENKVKEDNKDWVGHLDHLEMLEALVILVHPAL